MHVQRWRVWKRYDGCLVRTCGNMRLLWIFGTARTSPWEFLKAFGGHWGERMSGPASVPLMLLGLFIPNHYAAIGTGLLGIGCGVYGAYRVWAMERSRVTELEKISRPHLQRMLNGMFLGNTFMLGGEINLCKRYVGKFPLDQLCLEFDRVDVSAPGGSVATIEFRINAHREWSGKIYVTVRDGDGKIARVGDIYETMPILLGPNGEFFVKLARDEGVEFEDSTELWVTIEAWTK